LSLDTPSWSAVSAGAAQAFDPKSSLLFTGRTEQGPRPGIPDKAAEAAAKPRRCQNELARNSSSVAASPRPLKPEKKRWGGGVPPPAPLPRKKPPRFARKPRLRRRQGLRPFPAPCLFIPMPRQATRAERRGGRLRPPQGWAASHNAVLLSD
jgi:hypothetical protein